MSEKNCYNCGGTGHLARDCKNPRAEGEDREKINSEKRQYRRCFNCGQFGHIADDCEKPRNDKACYNCAGEGHIAKDCPEPRAPRGEKKKE
mmetsp:Transcript_6596/g.9854  ORF Transcript_6596/g.9854 Transcript_6596/m.9854 type:complete len:91 (+) Transcript_6596:86-358(+)